MNIDKRIKITLILSLLFFFSGLLFFYFRMSDKDENAEVMSLQGKALSTGEKERRIVLKDMPSPDKFIEFTYKNEEEMEVELDCKEEYAAVLIYDKNVDYRYDPLGAKFNTAFSCENRGKFKQIISLKSANLENGIKYYLVRAEQGKTSGWYDPY